MTWIGLAAVALLVAQLDSSWASTNSAGVVTPELNPVSNRKSSLSFATGGEAEGVKPPHDETSRENDLEEIRHLLLRTPEYPVKYNSSTMLYFYQTPRFPDMCVVAREVVDDINEDDIETEAESDSDAERRKRGLGRIVGVVGAGEVKKSSANIMMVAVDKDFRRMGLAKTMLKRVLMKASRFSLAHSGNTSILKDAMLHVWVPQLAPVQLYLSLGFIPTKYLRSYYREQEISAGYEMHLPLPYEKAEDRLAFDLNLRELRLKQLEGMWEERKAAGGLPSLAEHKGLGMTRFVSVSADSQILPSLRSFLQRAAPKGSDVNAIFSEITRPILSQLSFAAVEANGNVTGVVWVRSDLNHGIVEGTTLLVEADQDGYTYLSLFHHLLNEASQRGDLHAVQHKLYCDEVQTLTLDWKLGFHPVSFSPVPNRRKFGFSTYEYSMQIKLPWLPNREIVLRERLLVEGASNILSLPSPLFLNSLEKKQETESSPREMQLPIHSGEAPADEADNGSSVAAVAAAQEEVSERRPEVTTAEDGSVPWYRTVVGVACMLITCSLLMFLCFLSCAKRGGAAAAGSRGMPNQGRMSGSTVGCSRDSDSQAARDLQELQRRPVGTKEGYAHVTDEQGAAEIETQAWWDQEDDKAFNEP
ncbi:hypothetical protein Emag_000726 [Eimeria magna]